MSDELSRRQVAADKVGPIRQRLSVLERDIPYSNKQAEEERSLPTSETAVTVLVHLFHAFAHDRERFGTFLRGRLPEISDERLNTIVDEISRRA